MAKKHEELETASEPEFVAKAPEPKVEADPTRKRHLISMFGERRGSKMFDIEKKHGFDPKYCWPAVGLFKEMGK